MSKKMPQMQRVRRHE